MHTTMMISMSMEGSGRLFRKRCRSPLVNIRRLREPDAHLRMSCFARKQAPTRDCSGGASSFSAG